jgi:hypothetical protein
VPLGTQTLEGLGARGKARTGAGLGASAEGARADAEAGRTTATMTSAGEQARRAAMSSEPLALADADEDGDELTQARGERAAAPREESVAFALHESDLEEVTQARGAAPKSQPGSFAYGDEEVVTKTGDALAIGHEDPTQDGRGRLAAAEREAVLEAQRALERRPERPAAPLAQPPPAAPLTQTQRLGLGGLAQAPGPLAQPTPLAFEAYPVPAPPVRAPLLVDVTPLTLTVETIQGYCDPIIARNTPVPCEESREFVTASDNQSIVRVRVAQGESKRFQENTLLGEVELTGIPPAPRGAVQISVSFALDASGMLNVSAKDTATGRVTQAQLRLVGLPDAEDVAAMAQRQFQRQTA